MRRRLTLIIDDRGCGLYGAGEPLLAVLRDNAAVQDIRRRIASLPGVTVRVLLDTAAQDYRLESLPRLSPLDRHRLIARRLKQAFPDAVLAASERRGKGQAMLAGVTDGGAIGGWLDWLQSRRHDIGLLPAEGAALLNRLLPEARAGWGLLLAPMQGGGWRQIICHEGRLVFTRLTPAPSLGDPQAIAATAARDIRASLGYVSRMGLMDSRQLDALMLLPDAAYDACADIDLPLRSLHLLTPAAAGKQLGLTLPADGIMADGLLAGFAATRRRPALLLSPVSKSMPLSAAAVADWAWRGAMAVFACAALATGWQAAETGAALWRNHAKAAGLVRLKADLAQRQASAAPVTEPLGRLRMAIERQKLFTKEGMPWDTLTGIAHALGEEAKLMRLDWSMEPGKPASESLQLSLRLQATEGVPPGPELTVTRFRQVAAAIADALPEFSVDLTHLPYPALPQEAVSNQTMPDPAADLAEISIRRKP